MKARMFSIMALLAGCSTGFCQPGSLDTNFVAALGGNYGMAVQTDGKIVIGGPSLIARLNTNGSLDTNFQASVTGEVWSTAVQGDGKVLVAGRFTAIDGTPRFCVARLNSNGSLDDGFSPGLVSQMGGTYSFVFSVVPQPDGMVLIGGEFKSIGGVARNGIARLAGDGSVDSYFDPGAGLPDPGRTDSIRCVGLQPDGKILVAGGFSTFNGVARGNVARLNPDGSLDTNFNSVPGPNGFVMSLAIQPDGGVLIGGGFTAVDNVARSRIARLQPTGQLDESFNPGTGATDLIGGMAVWSVVRQQNGDVILGGGFSKLGGAVRNGVGKLHADGTLDTDFIPQLAASSRAYCLALQPDSKLLAGGILGLVRLDNFPRGIGPATLGLAVYAGLTIEGTVGGRYRIEQTVDPGTSNWLFLTDIILPKSPFLFIDDQSPGQVKRFYRALVNP